MLAWTGLFCLYEGNAHLVLTSNVPYSEADVLVFHRLHVEADLQARQEASDHVQAVI